MTDGTYDSDDFDLRGRHPYYQHQSGTITQQPKYATFRQWRDGIFDCSNDFTSCLWIGFCAPCYLCYMYHRYKEPACAPIFNPCAVVTLRSFHRGRERIRVSYLTLLFVMHEF
ncbi:Cornifelin [Paragonimus skrjabini miyazakii]|uniref:Cornifelin n=1 Tax=Paragonimus skrjabini miyazakii TaxID=59628 RepID=A0A8S9YWB6_9TREM|nr:Cornifelin [Paragonimus skrjabini miyazakii]